MTGTVEDVQISIKIYFSFFYLTLGTGFDLEKRKRGGLGLKAWRGTKKTPKFSSGSVSEIKRNLLGSPLGLR